MTRSKVDNMITRKVIVDLDIKNLYTSTIDFESTGQSIFVEENLPNYTISINYHDHTSKDNDIISQNLPPTTDIDKKKQITFFQIDNIIIEKGLDKRTLYGIDMLIKAYSLEKNGVVIVNDHKFAKEDVKNFLDIIYKTIVFSQCNNKDFILSTACKGKRKAAEAAEKVVKTGKIQKSDNNNIFNTYCHLLFRIADLTNKSLGDSEVTRDFRSLFRDPTARIKNLFNLDKLNKYYKILTAVVIEYRNKELELKLKIAAYKARQQTAPVAQPQTAQLQTAQLQIAQQPVAQQPVAQQLVAQQQAVQQTITQQTTNQQIAKQSIAQRQAVQQPSTSSAQSSTTNQPLIEQTSIEKEFIAKIEINKSIIEMKREINSGYKEINYNVWKANEVSKKYKKFSGDPSYQKLESYIVRYNAIKSMNPVKSKELLDEELDDFINERKYLSQNNHINNSHLFDYAVLSYTELLLFPIKYPTLDPVAIDLINYINGIANFSNVNLNNENKRIATWINEIIYGIEIEKNITKLNNIAKTIFTKMHCDEAYDDIKQTIYIDKANIISSFIITNKTTSSTYGSSVLNENRKIELKKANEELDSLDYLINDLCSGITAMQLGGASKVKILGRLRKIYLIKNKKYITYKKTPLLLSKAKKLEKVK
jgi:hypothetical protein